MAVIRCVSQASHLTSFCSPNLLEAQTLLGISVEHTRDAAQVASVALEALCRTKIVVRAGELGSFADGWVPAYWSAEQQHRVIDPTGKCW